MRRLIIKDCVWGIISFMPHIVCIRSTYFHVLILRISVLHVTFHVHFTCIFNFYVIDVRLSRLWRSVTRRHGCRLMLNVVCGGLLLWSRHCSTYLLYCTVFRFCTLVHFRCCCFEMVRFRFLHVCLVIMAGNCLWYILDWNFRDARGVYNGRLRGRSFSGTSVRLWRYVELECL